MFKVYVAGLVVALVANSCLGYTFGNDGGIFTFPPTTGCSDPSFSCSIPEYPYKHDYSFNFGSCGCHSDTCGSNQGCNYPNVFVIPIDSDSCYGCGCGSCCSSCGCCGCDSCCDSCGYGSCCDSCGCCSCCNSGGCSECDSCCNSCGNGGCGSCNSCGCDSCCNSCGSGGCSSCNSCGCNSCCNPYGIKVYSLYPNSYGCDGCESCCNSCGRSSGCNSCGYDLYRDSHSCGSCCQSSRGGGSGSYGIGFCDTCFTSTVVPEAV